MTGSARRLEGWPQRTEPAAILRDARKGALLRGCECISVLILRSLRSKRLEGWQQAPALRPSFETALRASSESVKLYAFGLEGDRLSMLPGPRGGKPHGFVMR